MRSRMCCLVAGLVVLSTACGIPANLPLANVEAVAPRPSPDLRDLHNRLDIHYHLNAPATVSARIVSESGSEWPVHQDALRPTAGDYVLQFDGTVAGPGPYERRVLPDGNYQVMLDVQSYGQRQEKPVPMTISGADASPPTITDLALLPDRITPNFDAQDDVTRVSYQLAKAALVAAYLDAVSADGHFTRVWMGNASPALAGEQSLTWDGVANGQPAPSGNYVLGIRARDAAGNIVEAGQPLTVADSGVPEATIVSAHIGPLQIIRGGQVCLDAIVRNTGQTVLRTEGPDQGYVYNSFDSFASIQNHVFAEHAGLWRVGLNWSSGTDLTGATYPYRWGFGRDLQPGDEATVHGCVTVVDEKDQIVFFAGLVQENVAIHGAGAGLVRVAVSS